MNNTEEFTGKTVDEAIDTALQTLQVSMDEVEVEILEMGNKGIFGLGSKEAKVRVTIKNTAGQLACNFLEGIFPYFGVHPECSKEYKEDILWITMQGEDLGALIGRRGETLDALQYLVNLATNRKSGEKQRILLDVTGFRQAREATLTALAKKMADKAIRTGKFIRLEPMNPHERRIIHMALQDDRRVQTFSEGEEPYRKVVIVKKHRS